MIDYLCFAGTKEGRVAEYIDHLHEHFVAPCVVENAAYQVPRAPGYSIEMKPETLIDYAWPRSSSARRARSLRSEEQTSELQSLMRSSYAVFCSRNKRTAERPETRVRNRPRELRASDSQGMGTRPV